MQAYTDELRHFIVENFLYGQPTPLADEDSFLDQGIIDSTGMLELVTFLEDRYQIQIEDHELVPENLDSIRRLALFLERKLNGSGLPEGRRAS